ncbi:MAG: phage terminase large subunit [Blastocatellia bacterium]
MVPTLKPTYKQHLAWETLKDGITKYPVFGGGAGGGKSWLGCEWQLTNAYLYPGYKGFIGRKELKRLMSSIYITWLKVCSYHKIPREDWQLNGQYNYIQFTNGSRIDLLDLAMQPSDPLYERFGSLEYTQGWIEEAGEVDFLAFDVLKSRVGRHRNLEFGLIGKILLTCNPNKGWLYREVYRPFKAGILPQEYAFIQSLYKDNPHTADEYGKDLSQIKDKANKQRLMFGNWEYDDDPSALMDYDSIVDLFTNAAEESDQKYMTVDVSRFGNDKIVIKLWKGLRVYKIIIRQKRATTQTAREVRDVAAQERIPYSHIIIDEDGVGGGVVDQVPGSKGFVANSTPLEDPTTNEKPNYRNLKTQCSYMLADAVNDHEIAIDLNVVSDVDGVTPETFKEDLIEELEQIKAKDPDSDDKKLQLIPKEEIKEMIGRSPDYADALMMRMYFFLDTKGEHRTRQHKVDWASKKKAVGRR